MNAWQKKVTKETPITLVRAIRDVGLDNVGVNFDAANLILYGKANPVDAVEILGPIFKECTPRTVSIPRTRSSSAKRFPSARAR